MARLEVIECTGAPSRLWIPALWIVATAHHSPHPNALQSLELAFLMAEALKEERQLMREAG